MKVLYELGGIHKFLIFHIYCEELKHIALDNISTARERENLSNRRIERQNKQEMCSNGEEQQQEEEQEGYWGEVVRQVIVRDLRGFGFEHASQPARSLIKKVISISQDNYPEQMDVCYLVNVPWVFNVLWHALQPLISSPNTANKVLVWDSNFLQALRLEVPLPQLPKILGGHVDPYKYTAEEMDAFMFRGEFSDNVNVRYGGGASTMVTSSRKISQSTEELDDDTGYSTDESSQGSSSSSCFDSERGLKLFMEPEERRVDKETSKRAVEFQSFDVDEALEMAVKM